MRWGVDGTGSNVCWILSCHGQLQLWKTVYTGLFSHELSHQFHSFKVPLRTQQFPLRDGHLLHVYLFSTLVYSRVYIPFPGPPALKDPPPPISMLRTQIGIKSGCWWEYPSRPITTWANSGSPDVPACKGIEHSSCDKECHCHYCCTYLPVAMWVRCTTLTWTEQRKSNA